MQIVNPLCEINRAEQRFAAQEPDAARNIEEMRNSLCCKALILGSGTQPDMCRPSCTPRREPLDEVRTLCQQQPVEVRRPFDQLPQPLARGAQTVPPLEHVGHRRAKDSHPRSGACGSAVPALRLLPGRLAEKAPGRLRAPHVVTGPLCPSLGVAVVAGRRHLRATPPGVERVIGPFDGRVLRHKPIPVRRPPTNGTRPQPLDLPAFCESAVAHCCRSPPS